jgi:methionyl-tRNA formyltransferase
MAVATGTLTVTITESLDVGTTVMDTATSIAETLTCNDIFKRVITCPTSEITLYTTHASAVAGSQFDEDKIAYVRVTNHDGSNYVTLRLTDAESNEFVYKLEAGKSFMLWTHKTAMSAKDGADTGAVDSDIVSMEATANSGACDLEILIASVS